MRVERIVAVRIRFVIRLECAVGAKHSTYYNSPKGVRQSWLYYDRRLLARAGAALESI